MGEWIGDFVSNVLKDYWWLGISASGGSNVNFQDLWKFVFSATGEHRYSLPLDAMITHLMALSVSPILNSLAQPNHCLFSDDITCCTLFKEICPYGFFAYPNIFFMQKSLQIYLIIHNMNGIWCGSEPWCNLIPMFTLWWTNIANWKDPPCFMGKSTISMAIFNSYVSHYQRVGMFSECLLWPRLIVFS